VENLEMSAFWRGRRVLLTGHTGFKGAWMALWLERLGAQITGFALPPPYDRDSLYKCAAPWPGLRSIIGDLRDAGAVARAVEEANPEIVIHMAAQALVRRSYADPVETFGTNVMGTVNLLSAAANRPGVRTILVVTSDKVYDNNDSGSAFCESDPLAGDDPYSASKAATEMVARSWRKSFMRRSDSPALGIARAGNVIGGGDWAEDRLVADVLRAGVKGEPVMLRYPGATRPWQHVLDVVSGYLAYAERLTTAPDDAPKALNFGPSPDEPAPTAREIVEQLQAQLGWDQGWVLQPGAPLPEKTQLSLDPSLAAATLSWQTKLGAADTLDWIARWHRAHLEGRPMRGVSLDQIAAFEALPMPAKNRAAAE
jgi:CDP-glucose 4,6-dehydratase